MDGVPTLEAFEKEVGYLADHVYNNSMLGIDRVDPVRNGTTEWQKMFEVMQNIQPGTPVKAALFRAYADLIRLRPADVATGMELLSRMRDTARGVAEVLRLHGKGDKEHPDTSFGSSAQWIRPEMTDLQLIDVHCLDKTGAADGVAVRIGKEFYETHKATLGLKPLDRHRLHDIIKRPDTFGRIGRQAGWAVGFYVCEVKADILRVIEWSVRNNKSAPKCGVPEFMALDLMDNVGPAAPLGTRFSRIECAVAETHEPTEAKPQTGTWRDMPPLF